MIPELISVHSPWSSQPDPVTSQMDVVHLALGLEASRQVYLSFFTGKIETVGPSS